MAYLGGKGRNGVENMDWPGLGQRPIFRAKSGESDPDGASLEGLECLTQLKEGRKASQKHPVVPPSDDFLQRCCL